jgi:hypothetical protein
VVAQTPAALFQQSFEVPMRLPQAGYMLRDIYFAVWVKIKIDNQSSGLLTKKYV